MSKIQTDNWVDKSEAVVISKLGPYKTKYLNETGYILHIPRKVSHYSAETEPSAVRVF